MTKKKNKKNSTVNVVVNNAQKPKSNRRAGKKRNGASRPYWLDNVVSPFTTTPVHIPDDQTRQSGLVTSRYHTLYNPHKSSNSGTALTHNGGILLRPYPAHWFLPLGCEDNGDVNPNYWAIGGATNGLAFVDVPNLAALIGNYGADATPTHSNCLVRCVGMGIRITYEGTELQRAGNYIGLQLSNTSAATSFTTVSSDTHYWYDPLSAYTGMNSETSAMNPSQWNNMALRSARSRVGEGVFEFSWIPNGTPSYQQLTSTDYTYSVYHSAGNTSTASTMYGNSKGAVGLEYGAGAIMVLIEGDTLAAAAVTGNTYAIDAIAHWEVVPHDLYSITYQVSLSPYLATELQKCLNHFGLVMSGSSLAVAGSSSGYSGGGPASGATSWVPDMSGLSLENGTRAVNAAYKAYSFYRALSGARNAGNVRRLGWR